MAAISSIDLAELYHEITKEKGKPLDVWEMTALLEIYGIRDIDAVKEYGFTSVFDMGEYMQKYIIGKSYPQKSLVNWEKIPPFGKRVFLNYIRGLAFAMPMFVQIFFTLTIGYALWSGVNMDQETATAIALGTFLALIVTGASAQAIGRKGLFYLKQDEFILAANVTEALKKVGLLIILGVGLVVLLIQLFFHIFPFYYFYVLIVFYLLLSFLFLNISVYYMFEEYTKILGFFLLAMILTYIAHAIIKVKLPEAQFISLVIINILLFILVIRKIRRLKKKNTISEGEEIPRASMLFYSLITFYMYGFFYFVFLVTDRIIAWSTYVPAKPYFIWFNVPYELGLDWALIVLILMMGFTEISIHEFMYRINDLVIQYKYKEYKKFNREIKNFFTKFNIVYLVFAIVIILLTYYVTYWLYHYWHIRYLGTFFHSYTPYVFWVAAISYVFMVNGLMNVLFIFSFSRQNFSITSIAIAVGLNILVGLILSRMFGLEYAVLGLLIGSLVFWIISFSYTVKMLRKMEYYYYSAF